MASLCHDIGLMQMPPEVQTEDESKMTEPMRALYRTHPTVAAGILASIPGVDPAVIQAVTQHHDRRDKSGFSNRAQASTLHRVAEMVGIADEYVRLMEKTKVDPNFDVYKEMEKTILPGFSRSIVDAFKKVFGK